MVSLKLHRVAKEAVHFDMLKETTQNRDENPTQHMAFLDAALR